MEKVFCQRITNPGFSLFTLMLPVTKPQVWINSNVERMKRMAPHGVSKTQKSKKKTKQQQQKQVFPVLQMSCSDLWWEGAAWTWTSSSRVIIPASLPARPPACPGECVQVAPAEESHKKKGAGL